MFGDSTKIFLVRTSSQGGQRPAAQAASGTHNAVIKKSVYDIP